MMDKQQTTETQAQEQAPHRKMPNKRETGHGMAATALVTLLVAILEQVGYTPSVEVVGALSTLVGLAWMKFIK